MLNRDWELIEHYRREIEQYDPYQSDAAQWEETLNRIVGAMLQRDLTLHETLSQAAFGSRWQQSQAGELLQAIDTDIFWLHQRMADLASFQYGGGGGGPADLSQQQNLLSLHLLGRQARRAEVLVEIGTGQFDTARWATAWQELESAWEAQTAFFNQWRAGDESLDDQRLAWLRSLYDLQSQVALAMPEGPGRPLLHSQMAEVSGRINRYIPAPASPGGGAGSLVGLLVIALIIAAVFGIGSRSGGAASGGARVSPLVPIVAAPSAPGAPADPGATPAAIGAALVPITAPDFIARGLDARRAGQYGDAASLFQQGIAMDAARSTGYTQLAFCLYELGQVDEAIQRWNEAIEHNSGDADALAGLGMALYGRGEPEQGLARYREALGIDPRYGDERFLQAEQAWSAGAIAASRPLRAALAP